MTHRERLQSLADESRTPDQYEFVIEWRPFRGWWANADDYWNPQGEFLGNNHTEAAKTLRMILG